MCNRLRRYATGTRANGWLAWLPLVFVAAMLFWTVALGLGGLSLMAVSAIASPDGDEIPAVVSGPAATVTEPMPGAEAGPSDGILVHIEQSPEPDDQTATLR